jgi:D-aspartate ligase
VVPDRTAPPIALVIGGGAIEVVRSLQVAGLPCAVVTTPGDATKYSGKVDSVFHWDWTQPLEAHDEALADRLVAWADTHSEPPVLFYSSDQALLFVSRQRDRLALGFRFAIPDAELVEAVADKALFATLAGRLALPVPATTVLPPGLAEPPDLTELGFPLIIKPERRDRTWRHVCDSDGVKVKALVVESERQLRELWPKLVAMGRSLVAQQYVSGPESAIESYHVYSDKTGEIVAEFTGRKIRTYPVECGFTTSLSVTREEDVRYAGRKLVELLDLRGVAKFDFKRAPDGQLFLFEINARTSLWMHPGARAGVNIPAAVYADLTGRPRPALASRPRPVSWVHPKDVLAARDSGMPMGRWLRFAAGCRAKAFWYWRDPMPFVGVAVSRARTGNLS